MDTEDLTNQVVDEGATDTDTLDTNGVTDEQLLDDDGNPIEPAEDEDEIELDGDLKLKLPKSQAEALKMHILRQADYTRKTQAHAETVKAFEAERTALQQADEQELSARANLTLINGQLQRYSQIDWNQWNDTDPFEAQKQFQQYQLLKDQKTNVEGYLRTASEQRTQRQQQEHAKLVMEGAAELARSIPGWSPDLSAKLQDFGVKEFGLSKEDFDNVTDARAVKLLHAAYQWSEHQKGTKKAQAIQKQQEVAPTAAVSKNKAPPQGLDDRLSQDEWLKRRNAQLAKRA